MTIKTTTRQLFTARMRASGSDWLAQKLPPALHCYEEELEPEGLELSIDLALAEILDGMPEQIVISTRMMRDRIAAALVD